MALGAQTAGSNLSRDEQLRGRQNVRHALRAIGPDIEVFFNPKINFEAMDDIYDRPLDIVLVHKTKGILGLAIKSGEIVEETGGLVSQYQPAKQYYKIIDPVKKAQKALLTLLDECDPAIKDYASASVGVVFPDTHRAEFSDRKALYLFKENLTSSDLQRDIEEMFIEIWDIHKSQLYADNYARIVEFLKTHSDNNIQRVQRKETLSKLGIREEKKAFQVPQTPLKKAGDASRAPSAQSQGGEEAPVANLRAGQNKRVAPRVKVVRVNPQQDDVRPVAAKRRISKEQEEAQRKRLVDFFNQIDEGIKMQQSVELSGAQWGLAIACAAIFICVAYFIGRNASIILHMH